MDYTSYIIELLGKNNIINSDTTMKYDITYEKLIKMYKLENWDGNRPPDMKRIPEIKNILHLQNYVDGVIYLASYDEKTLVCYDGMHRLTALKEIYENTDKKIEHTLTINILPRYDSVFISKKIEELNKCKPITFASTSHRDKLYDITNIIYTKYNNMFSKNTNPRLPNEFRDNFVDKLSDIITSLKLNHTNNDKIIQLIENYNNYIIKNKNQLKNLSSKQLQKCEKNKCFIFALRGWEHILIDYYEKNIITID